MPLFDCKECGSHQAGYWHCRDRRDNIKGIFLRVGIFLLILAMATGVAIWTVKLG